MEKIIWSYDREKDTIVIDLSGTRMKFEAVLSVMMNESEHLAASLTGVVVDFWQNGCGVHCGKLSDMVTRKTDG